MAADPGPSATLAAEPGPSEGPSPILECLWRVQALSLESGGLPWSRSPLFGLDSESLPVERVVSAPPVDTSAQTNLRALPATLGPVGRAKSLFTCRRRMKKARVQVASAAPTYQLDTYQDSLHDLAPLPSLADEVDFTWADASKWVDADERGTPITFDDDAEDLDGMRVAQQQAQQAGGQMQGSLQPPTPQSAQPAAQLAQQQQQAQPQASGSQVASSPSLRGAPSGGLSQPSAALPLAPREFSSRRAPQLLCPDLYVRELGPPAAPQLPRYTAAEGLAPPLPAVSYTAVIPHPSQLAIEGRGGEARRQGSGPPRRPSAAVSSSSSSSDSEMELGLNPCDLTDYGEPGPPGPPPGEPPRAPAGSAVDLLEGLLMKEGEAVFTRHALHALVTSPYDVTRLFFDKPCSGPGAVPEAVKARDILVCGEAAAAVEPPALLVGYQGDWLETDMAAWNVWAEAMLEPVVSRKDITYYVVVPGALAIHDTVKAFFKDLSAVYETCNLGTHVKALKFGYWSVPLPDALPDGTVDRPALQKAYHECCDHLGQHIGQLASTNIGGLQRYDGATVVYLVAPFSYQAVLSELLKASAILLQQASRNPDLHVLTQVVPVEDVMQPLASQAALALELAFSIFNKARRHLVLSSSSRPRPLSPPSDPGTPAVLPATGPRPNCYRHVYEPAFLLAHVPPLPSSALPPHEDAAAASEDCRALHGCYASAANGTILIVVWTDSLGEVLDVHSLIAEPPLAGGRPLSRSLIEAIWTQACTWMSASRSIQHLVLARLGSPPPEEIQAWEDFFAALELGGEASGGDLFPDAFAPPLPDGASRAPEQLRSASFISLHCCSSLLAHVPCSGCGAPPAGGLQEMLSCISEVTLEVLESAAPAACSKLALRLHVLSEGRSLDVMRSAGAAALYLQAVARQLHALSFAMLSFHTGSRLYPLPLHVTSVAAMSRVIQHLRRASLDGTGP